MPKGPTFGGYRLLLAEKAADPYSGGVTLDLGGVTCALPKTLGGVTCALPKIFWEG